MLSLRVSRVSFACLDALGEVSHAASMVLFGFMGF